MFHLYEPHSQKRKVQIEPEELFSTSVLPLVITLHSVSPGLEGEAVLHSHQMGLVLMTLMETTPGEGQRKKSGATASKPIPASLMPGQGTLVK